MIKPLEACCIHRKFSEQNRTSYCFDDDYILYAVEGSILLYLNDRLWVLPPAFAAWIPRKKSFEIELKYSANACSVVFREGFLPFAVNQPVVFPMSALGRELIKYCRHWSDPNAELDAQGKNAFLTLGGVCRELSTRPSSAWHPVPKLPLVKRAVTFTRDNLHEQIELSDVANAVCSSKRTIMRHFQKDIGITWRHTLRRLRVNRAIEYLVVGNLSVTEIGLEVGYQSLSAFNKAFRNITDETPADFRRRSHEVNKLFLE